MQKKMLLTILIFGSLWGCIEVFAGGALKEVIPRGVGHPAFLVLKRSLDDLAVSH